MVRVLTTLDGRILVQQPDKEERPRGGTSSARQALVMFSERCLAGTTGTHLASCCTLGRTSIAE
eukprot:2325224-Heterocapsa_arctica.AAC.1